MEVDGKPVRDGPFPVPLMVAGREVEYGTCLSRTAGFPAADDTGGRSCAAGWIFTPEGRGVLMRRYNGPEWDNYAALERSPTFGRDGVTSCLWHDCVLWPG